LTLTVRNNVYNKLGDVRMAKVAPYTLSKTVQFNCVKKLHEKLN